MNLQPVLQDDYLLLRPLQQSDFEALYAAASDPLIWEQHPSQRHLPEVFERFFQDSLASEGALVAIRKEDGSIIGSSRYKLLPNAETAVEIGWSFLQRIYWGGETNGRMKKLMIEHARAEGMKTIVFRIGIHNIRSQKAVEKIGGVLILAKDRPDIVDERSEYCTFILNPY